MEIGGEQEQEQHCLFMRVAHKLTNGPFLLVAPRLFQAGNYHTLMSGPGVQLSHLVAGPLLAS